MITYSNPRTSATFTDWPSGGHRTTAMFAIETHPTRGQRATRITLHPLTGRPSAPKLRTYSVHARIVDGDDGRTYIAEFSIYGLIAIIQSNLQFEAEIINRQDPRYPDLRAMVKVIIESLTPAEIFFYRHAPYAVPPGRLETAKRLAAAEKRFLDSPGWIEYQADCAVMRDASGLPLSSIDSITHANDSMRRIVRAQLALIAYPEE